MRVAVIDLGTNTFNLLIADLDSDGHPEPVFKTRIPVRMGEKINDGIITDEAYHRGINAIKEFKSAIETYFAQHAAAFATSAIRSSTNGKAFCKEIEEATGIQVNIIDGEREAELIYYGVSRALDLGTKPSLILDIGGGSNEFIIGNKKNILWKKSFNLGIARLLNKFNPRDPLSSEEHQVIRAYLKEELAELFSAVNDFPVTELIGASGSFETFADIAAKNFRDDPDWDTTTEFRFRDDEFDRVFNRLLYSSKQERKDIDGMLEMRSDMIVLAAILVDLVVKEFDLKKIRVSDYSLQEGVLYSILKN